MQLFPCLVVQVSQHSTSTYLLSARCPDISAAVLLAEVGGNPTCQKTFRRIYPLKYKIFANNARWGGHIRMDLDYFVL